MKGENGDSETHLMQGYGLRHLNKRFEHCLRVMYYVFDHINVSNSSQI